MIGYGGKAPDGDKVYNWTVGVNGVEMHDLPEAPATADSLPELWKWQRSSSTLKWAGATSERSKSVDQEQKAKA